MGGGPTGLNNPAGIIGTLSAKALVNEVCATPKPGLVDMENSGAHSDMDLGTFLHSAQALMPYLIELAQAGYLWRGSSSELFPNLRRIGQRAEEAMLSATGGVNTHKGAVFSVGLVCAAGGLFYRQNGHLSAEGVLQLCGEIAGKALAEDFKRMNHRIPHTHGEIIYATFGVRGIRGEAAEGFPSVRNISLPQFRQLRRKGVRLNEAMVQTLLHLIAEVLDTNVLYRVGPDMLDWAQERAREVLERGGILDENGYGRLVELDREFTVRNISPGGCADLLSVTFLTDALEQI